MIHCYISVRCKSMWIFAFSIWCDSILQLLLQVTFLVTADQSCTTSPQYRTTSTLWCWWVSFQVIPQHFSWIKVWTLTWFFLNHSLVKLFVCLGSLSYSMTCFLLRLSSQTDVLTFSFTICWYNSEFIVPSMIASRPGPDSAKQGQTMILPPLCFTDGIIFLCWNEVCSFLQT